VVHCQPNHCPPVIPNMPCSYISSNGCISGGCIFLLMMLNSFCLKKVGRLLHSIFVVEPCNEVAQRMDASDERIRGTLTWVYSPICHHKSSLPLTKVGRLLHNSIVGVEPCNEVTPRMDASDERIRGTLTWVYSPICHRKSFPPLAFAAHSFPGYALPF
jgi:hypothetical protein